MPSDAVVSNSSIKTADVNTKTNLQDVPRPVAGDAIKTEGIPDILFQSSTVLDLFPIVVRVINDAESSIVRIGGKVLTAVSTSSVGVEAVRRLQNGHSIGAVQSALSKKYDSTTTDLSPLITALYRARMIRSANGIMLATEAPDARKALVQKIKWAGFSLRRTLTRWALVYLPLRIGYGILYVVRPRLSRAKQREVLRQTKRNLEQVFGPSLLPQQLDRLADDSLSELIRRDLDMEILNAFPDLRVAQWIRRSCTISGLNFLDEALARNKGVILFSFHFSSAHLIILILWLNGYSFTGAGGITRTASSRVLPFDNEELQARLGGCGKVKWFSHFNFDSVLAMLKALESGGMILVYPDSIWERPAKQVAEYFGHGAAKYRPARVMVPFLGRSVEANKGAPWLYQQSEAPFIPLKLIRTSNTEFHLSIGPEVTLERNSRIEALTAELYRVLEREVCLDPATWAYLRILHKFMVSPVQGQTSTGP